MLVDDASDDAPTVQASRADTAAVLAWVILALFALGATYAGVQNHYDAPIISLAMGLVGLNIAIMAVFAERGAGRGSFQSAFNAILYVGIWLLLIYFVGVVAPRHVIHDTLVIGYPAVGCVGVIRLMLRGGGTVSQRE